MNYRKFSFSIVLCLLWLCWTCQCSAGLVYDAYMSHHKTLVLLETTKYDPVERVTKIYQYTEIYRNKNLKTRYRLEIREEKGKENSEELIIHVFNYDAKDPFYNKIVFINSYNGT